MIPSPEYWKAVAEGIDAEERKASLFIKHNQSVGAAREEILKDFLRKHTPEPYRVRSGFIHRLYDQPDRNYCSPQLDVVVYNAMVAQPDYEVGNLVVVPGSSFGCAAAIVEVKTYLDSAQFTSVLGTWEEVYWLNLPTFGFSFEGVKFEKFVEYLTKAMKDNPAGLPECIAVHRENYLFVREGYRGQERKGRHREAKLQLAVNYGAELRGRSAGTLLHLYLGRLKSPVDFNHLKDWFNRLQLPQDAKLSFSDAGDCTTGNLE